MFKYQTETPPEETAEENIEKEETGEEKEEEVKE